jgi:hypothetical protein
MKVVKLSLGLSVGAVLALSLVALFPSSVLAQADGFLGTWTLNVAKSKYSPGPPPKAQTSTYEASGQGVKVTVKGTGADGKPTTMEFTANYDGKDYPVTGNADYDATSLKRIDAYTVEFTRKKGGKVVQTGTNVVSKDGKTRTVTTKGTNAQGQQISNVAIYEKS